VLLVARFISLCGPFPVAESSAAPRLQPECRVIIFNVAKKQNIGNIVRSAVAFGVSEFIIVGKGKVNTFGNKDTNKFIRFTFFDTLQACKESLKKEGFSIVGIEIGEGAKDVNTHPFTGPTAFILGNEVLESHRAHCISARLARRVKA